MKRGILKKLRKGVKLTPEEINIISKESTRDKKYGFTGIYDFDIEGKPYGLNICVPGDGCSHE